MDKNTIAGYMALVYLVGITGMVSYASYIAYNLNLWTFTGIGNSITNFIGGLLS